MEADTASERETARRELAAARQAERVAAEAAQRAQAVAGFEDTQRRLIEATLGVPYSEARCTDCAAGSMGSDVDGGSEGAGCRHFEDHRSLVHLGLKAGSCPDDVAVLCPVCHGARVAVVDGVEVFCTHSEGSISRLATAPSPVGPTEAMAAV
jgi:Zn finger protein HypA/HybF involved in hydrogenase expression